MAVSAKVAHDISNENIIRTQDIAISENVDFESMLLSKDVLKGLKNSGFLRPSPIQLKSIPLGRCGLDLIVQAKSGTGKTCVFTVVALEGLQIESSATQVLVLAPTREIAFQIWQVIMSIGSGIEDLACATFIGGISLTDDKENLKKCHIAVGTPGRVKFLIEQNYLKTKSIRLFVLDEADQLLDECFQADINWIYSVLPENKQILALSATYPEYLMRHMLYYMRNPTYIRLDVTQLALLGIKQYYLKIPFHPHVQKAAEYSHDAAIKVLSSVSFNQCLIFSNLLSGAQSLAFKLEEQGWPTCCIAGCLEQKERNEAMASLKSFQCRVLISTDLTSRGIDAENVNLVINLDLPRKPRVYLHRIGRAGRFGSQGAAISFVPGDMGLKMLKKIQTVCNTTLQPLPNPIPNDLVSQPCAKRPIKLDDIIHTQTLSTANTVLKKDTLPKTSADNSTSEKSIRVVCDSLNLRTSSKELQNDPTAEIRKDSAKISEDTISSVPTFFSETSNFSETVSVPDSAKRENTDFAKRENTDSAKRENTDSAKHENTDSAKRENTDFAKRENTDFAKRENTDFAKRENTDFAKRENTDFAKRENTDSAKRENTDFAKRENTDFAKRENTDFAKRENTDFAKRENTDFAKRENTDFAKRENTDFAKRENTDFAKRENTDFAKRENTDSAKRENTDSAKRENTDSAKRENTDSAKRENTDFAKRENTDFAKRENTDFAKRENTDFAKRENTDFAKRENTDFAKRENTDFAKRENTDSAKRENTDFAKRENFDVSIKETETEKSLDFETKDFPSFHRRSPLPINDGIPLVNQISVSPWKPTEIPQFQPVPNLGSYADLCSEFECFTCDDKTEGSKDYASILPVHPSADVSLNGEVCKILDTYYKKTCNASLNGIAKGNASTTDSQMVSFKNANDDSNDLNSDLHNAYKSGKSLKTNSIKSNTKDLRLINNPRPLKTDESSAKRDPNLERSDNNSLTGSEPDFSDRTKVKKYRHLFRYEDDEYFVPEYLQHWVGTEKSQSENLKHAAVEKKSLQCHGKKTEKVSTNKEFQRNKTTRSENRNNNSVDNARISPLATKRKNWTQKNPKNPEILQNVSSSESEEFSDSSSVSDSDFSSSDSISSTDSSSSFSSSSEEDEEERMYYPYGYPSYYPQYVYPYPWNQSYSMNANPYWNCPNSYYGYPMPFPQPRLDPYFDMRSVSDRIYKNQENYIKWMTKYYLAQKL